MKSHSCLCILILIVCTSFRQNTEKVKDYFTIPGPVEFNKIVYNLSWSSHPAANYYKHEYLSGNEKSGTFNKMIMIEVVNGDIAVADAVKAKINELEQRKKIDAVVNYQVIENKNTGEYLLDFVLSQSYGNKNAIVEWNAYRYTSLKDKSGKKGVLLFAYSKRGYGENAGSFLKLLKTGRVNDINALSSYKIPAVKI